MRQPTKATDSQPQRDLDASSDQAIVERVLGGERAAYELIMRRYNQRLFRVVRGMLNDDSEAEDVVQDAYVRAYEHLDQFAGRSQFSTWLTKIAVYEAAARQRQRQRMKRFANHDLEQLSSPLHGSSAGALDAMNANELRQLLTEAVDGLPDDLRVVFTMRVVEELNTQETAACLSLTEANVKVRLHRAKAQLRAHIDQRVGREVRHLYQFDGQRCERMVQAVRARLAKRTAGPGP